MYIGTENIKTYFVREFMLTRKSFIADHGRCYRTQRMYPMNHLTVENLHARVR